MPNFWQTKETVSGQFQNNQEQDEQEGFTTCTALCVGLNKGLQYWAASDAEPLHCRTRDNSNKPCLPCNSADAE